MSRIIRSGRAAPSSGIMEARGQAEALLEAARAEAAALVEAAHADAASRRNQAWEAGEQAARAEAAALVARARALHDHARAQAEQDLVRLAVGVAERLLGAELSLDPSRIRDIVREVLSRAPRAVPLRVFVHPDDAARVASLSELAGATVIGDAGLALGDCIIETDLGQLDGRLSLRLAALERALLG
ncbi:MAG: hypothetical protein KF901_28780 [Myxococcales bacterium]|nr:hypothetical protein [Myxococcales bacterium]